MEPSKEICVVVAHGEPIVAAGLRALIDLQEGFCVGDLPLARPASATHAPIVVADYQSGMRLLADRPRIAQHEAQPRVVLVTSVDREWDIRHAVAQGVNGYLMQGCSAAELIDSLHSVAQGRRYLCSTVALRMADSMMCDELTGRETDVLGLLSAGFCNKSIARELGIAVGTVKAHVKGILEKLDATTRTQAVVVASRRGLVRTPNDAASMPFGPGPRQAAAGCAATS